MKFVFIITVLILSTATGSSNSNRVEKLTPDDVLKATCPEQKQIVKKDKILFCKTCPNFFPDHTQPKGGFQVNRVIEGRFVADSDRSAIAEFQGCYEEPDSEKQHSIFTATIVQRSNKIQVMHPDSINFGLAGCVLSQTDQQMDKLLCLDRRTSAAHSNLITTFNIISSLGTTPSDIIFNQENLRLNETEEDEPIDGLCISTTPQISQANNSLSIKCTYKLKKADPVWLCNQNQNSVAWSQKTFNFSLEWHNGKLQFTEAANKEIIKLDTFFNSIKK